MNSYFVSFWLSENVIAGRASPQLFFFNIWLKCNNCSGHWAYLAFMFKSLKNYLPMKFCMFFFLYYYFFLFIFLCVSYLLCRYYLISHLESVHQNPTFPCDKCGLQARSKAMLQNHYREAHDNVSVFCGECDFVTNSQVRFFLYPYSFVIDIAVF